MIVDFDDKAGNAGDVLKHVVLGWLLDRVASLRIPVTFVETHAGRGRYHVDLSTGNRAHLLRALPDTDTGPTSAATRIYRKHLRMGGDGSCRYPGSPTFAFELLTGNTAAAFFERDAERRRSLETQVKEVIEAAHPWARLSSIGEDAWADPEHNTMKVRLQQAYGLGVTLRPSTVVALVDPFVYAPMGEADTSRGEVGRDDLGRFAKWCMGLAAGAESGATGLCAPMCGILMVWTKKTGRALYEDMLALRDTFPSPSRVEAVGIESGGKRLDYSVVVLGFGSTGESVVSRLGRTGEDGVDWEEGALLSAWDFALVKGAP